MIKKKDAALASNVKNFKTDKNLQKKKQEQEYQKLISDIGSLLEKARKDIHQWKKIVCLLLNMFTFLK